MFVDLQAWRDFRVGDLFIQERGKESAPNQNDDGHVPLIKEMSVDNGYDRDVIPTKIIKGNCITISVNYASVVFYQRDDFCASVNILILRNQFLNEYVGLFIASTLSYVHKKYDYIYKISKERLDDEIIKLPATPSGEPDWDYMESYMRDVMAECERKYSILVQMAKERHLLDVSDWGEFRVGDLFDISRPVSRNDKSYDIGNVPYVASGSANNGVMGYLAPKSASDFDVGNCITVSPIDGYAFYQKDRFLGRGGAGSSIMILRCDMLSELSGLFIATIIRFVCSDWSYSNMGNKDVLANLMVRLPIVSAGVPDWGYMEEYMENVINRQAYVVRCLSKINLHDDF